jgi:signal transduction histidine kinase
LARVEIERGAERATQLMQLVWQRRATSPEPPLGGASWSGSLADLEPSEARTGPSPSVSSGSGEAAFKALLARAEAAGDRQLLLSALERYPEARSRPEAHLRSIQMAVAAADLPAASAAFSQAYAELVPAQARGDVSYGLLAALAAAPALDAAARAAAQADLVASWSAGELRLPEPEDRWRADPPPTGEPVLDPRFEVWARSLEDLSPAHAEAARHAARRSSRELRALWEHLGAPALPPEDGRWHALGEADWLARVEAGGSIRIAPFDPSALAAAVQLEAHAGDGFDLTGPGPLSSSVVAIADHEWPLYQPGLPAEVESQARRQRGLRVGFELLSILVLAATVLTFAALVRRRHLDELKTRFIAGVSHDLRTPLASILIMAENLESGRVADKTRQAKYHSSIRREAARLGRLVDDVLDFSRLERGESAKLVLEDVRLDELVELLQTECTERVEQDGAHLDLELGSLPTSAVLDASALRRAVLNLIENALRHSGSKELELAIHRHSATLRIEVADQGCGVPPAKRALLFEAFQQGSQHNPAAGGAGLGLSIVRELARAHGGEAAFVDQAGPGTRVRISLPLSPSHEET